MRTYKQFSSSILNIKYCPNQTALSYKTYLRSVQELVTFSSQPQFIHRRIPEIVSCRFHRAVRLIYFLHFYSVVKRVPLADSLLAGNTAVCRAEWSITVHDTNSRGNRRHVILSICKSPTLTGKPDTCQICLTTQFNYFTKPILAFKQSFTCTVYEKYI